MSKLILLLGLGCVVFSDIYAADERDGEWRVVGRSRKLKASSSLAPRDTASLSGSISARSSVTSEGSTAAKKKSRRIRSTSTPRSSAFAAPRLARPAATGRFVDVDPLSFLGIDSAYHVPTMPQRASLFEKAQRGDAKAALVLLLNQPGRLLGKSEAILRGLFPYQARASSPEYAAVALLLSKIKTPLKPTSLKYQGALRYALRQYTEGVGERRWSEFVCAINSLDLAKEAFDDAKSGEERAHINQRMIESYKLLEDFAEWGSLRAMYYLLYFSTQPWHAGKFDGMYKLHGFKRNDLLEKYLPLLKEGHYPFPHIGRLVYPELTVQSKKILLRHFPVGLSQEKLSILKRVKKNQSKK